MKVIGSISVPGRKINEDGFGWTDDVAWVLDGATGLGRTHLETGSDAAWYVEAFSESLRQTFRSDAAIATRKALVAAIERTARLFRERIGSAALQSYETPSAGLALVRFAGHTAELLTLGDCKIIYRAGRGQAIVFGDSHLEALDSIATQQLRDFQKCHAQATLQEALAAVQDTLRQHRSMMNREGGYWVLGLDVGAVDHACTSTLDLTGAEEFSALLATDGVTRLFDTFPLYAPGAALDLVLANEGSELIATLREAENGDPECRVYPRFKKSDDATFVCLSRRNP